MMLRTWRRPHAVLPRASGAADDATTAHGAAPLADDAQESSPPRSPLLLRARGLLVDRSWLEKALAVVDAAQQFALLWQLSQPWPWPARWLRASRWANAFNLDMLSFRATGAAMGSTAQAFSLWGEMRHYWAYALAWGLLPPVSVLALCLSSMRWRARGDTRFLARRISWENVLLQLFQVLYVPVGIAVLRLVNCGQDGVVSVDPGGLGGCGTARHVAAVVVITCILGGGFLLGLPLVLRARIRSSLVHDDPDDHERFLRCKEVEYILGTSEAYLELYLPQCASYRREAAHAPVEACLFKLSLLLVFSALRSPAPRTDNQSLQGILFFALLAARGARQASRRLYRCSSSSVVERLLALVLAANGLLGMLCASGVRSALTVSTAMAAMLSVVNVTFLVILALYLAKTALAAHSQASSQSGVTFWLARREVKDALLADPRLPSMVTALYDARMRVREALLVTPAMRPYDKLDDALRRLETCYSQAVETKHYLSDQLRDTMYLTSEVLTDAVASNPFQCAVFPQNDLQQLGRLHRRQRKRRFLMTPVAQRVLTRLDAARAWRKNAAPLNGEKLRVDPAHSLNSSETAKSSCGEGSTARAPVAKTDENEPCEAQVI